MTWWRTAVGSGIVAQAVAPIGSGAWHESWLM